MKHVPIPSLCPCATHPTTQPSPASLRALPHCHRPIPYKLIHRAQPLHVSARPCPMPRAVFWHPAPKVRLPRWRHSCRPLCQATLASEGLPGKKPEPPLAPASADRTPKTAAGCRPRGAERRAEPAPGLGVHQVTVSPVLWALAHSGDAVREMKWPGSEVRKPCVSGQVSPFTLTRGFFPLNVFAHIFAWLVAIKVCHHARNCWLLVGEICGFKHGFVRGRMRKHKHCGCAGLLRLPGRDCQRGWQGWIPNTCNLHFIMYYWRTYTSRLENEAVITRWKSIHYEACFWPRCKAVLSGAELLWSSKGHALIHCAIQQQLPNRGTVVFLTVTEWLLFACQIQLTCPALQPFGKKEQTQLAHAVVTTKASSSELRHTSAHGEDKLWVKIYSIFWGDKWKQYVLYQVLVGYVFVIHTGFFERARLRSAGLCKKPQTRPLIQEPYELLDQPHCSGRFLWPPPNAFLHTCFLESPVFSQFYQEETCYTHKYY